MTLIDSKAAFHQRCAEVSTAATSLFDLLAAQNVSSFSELAFACGIPNRASSDDEFKTFADSVLRRGATAGQNSLLRRLHFEAATLVFFFPSHASAASARSLHKLLLVGNEFVHSIRAVEDLHSHMKSRCRKAPFFFPLAWPKLHKARSLQLMANPFTTSDPQIPQPDLRFAANPTAKQTPETGQGPTKHPHIWIAVPILLLVNNTEIKNM